MIGNRPDTVKRHVDSWVKGRVAPWAKRVAHGPRVPCVVCREWVAVADAVLISAYPDPSGYAHEECAAGRQQRRQSRA